MFIAFLAAVIAAANVPNATAIDVGSWFSEDDYPTEAKKKGIEGSTTFEVDVNAEGKPTACRITRSSGSAILDQATCNVVLSRAKFKPAMRHGKAVASRYSKTTSWRLDAGGVPTDTGYVATILDFSGDPDHTTCMIVNKGLSAGPACAHTLQTYGVQAAREKLTKLVVLLSITTGDMKPFRGDPAWGERLAFVAIDLYSPTIGTKPACAVVAKEGLSPQEDPCGQYADAGKLSDDEKRNAKKAHIEQSLFGVLRRTTAQEKCKDGESATEVHGCV